MSNPNDDRVTEKRGLLIAYKNVFGSTEGKTVLFDLMNRFHILNPHRGNELSEGERSVVLHIMKQCRISLQQFDELMKGPNK